MMALAMVLPTKDAELGELSPGRGPRTGRPRSNAPPESVRLKTAEVPAQSREVKVHPERIRTDLVWRDAGLLGCFQGAFVGKMKATGGKVRLVCLNDFVRFHFCLVSLVSQGDPKVL